MQADKEESVSNQAGRIRQLNEAIYTLKQDHLQTITEIKSDAALLTEKTDHQHQTLKQLRLESLDMQRQEKVIQEDI